MIVPVGPASPTAPASHPVVAESAESRCSSTVEPALPRNVSRVGPECSDTALSMDVATTSCTSAGSTSAGTTTSDSLLVERPYAVDTVTGPGIATGGSCTRSSRELAVTTRPSAPPTPTTLPIGSASKPDPVTDTVAPCATTFGVTPATCGAACAWPERLRTERPHMLDRHPVAGIVEPVHRSRSALPYGGQPARRVVVEVRVAISSRRVTRGSAAAADDRERDEQRDEPAHAAAASPANRNSRLRAGSGASVAQCDHVSG